MKAVIAIIASYLLGSISFGYLTGKLLKGIDIRQYGSGNAGTTNIQRTLGTIPALVVLLLDVGKGIVAVTIAKYLSDVSFIHLLAGLAVVIGHNWPLFFGFRGGRGIATTIGVFCGLVPAVVLVAVVVGLIIIAVTRYVSLGSIIGALSIPITMLILKMPATHIIFGVVMALMAVWRHRQNIDRLLRGTENKLGMKVDLGDEGK